MFLVEGERPPAKHRAYIPAAFVMLASSPIGGKERVPYLAARFCLGLSIHPKQVEI